MSTGNLYKNQFQQDGQQDFQQDGQQERPSYDTTHGQGEENNQTQQDRDHQDGQDHNADLENLNMDMRQIAGMDVSGMEFNYNDYIPLERTEGVGQEADTDQPTITQENQPMEGLHPHQ